MMVRSVVHLLMIIPLMVHLFIYGVREAIAQNRSWPDGRDGFGFPRPALPEFLFSFSTFIAALLPSFFHASGFPIFLFPFS